MDDDMRNRFEKQLEQVHNELIEMGNLVEKSIQMAITVFLKKDEQLAQEAIDFDREINRQERKVEGLCMRLLLEQQPVAKDLRMLYAALKMIADMERIGDYAQDIAESVLQTPSDLYISDLPLTAQMAMETVLMVTRSVEAFVQSNLEMAKSILAQDDALDAQYEEMKQLLVQKIKEHPEHGMEAVEMLIVARHLERIGDHAVNIAEWVIYSITGRHAGKRELEEEQLSPGL
ncbi:phosphate transport system regulatory protein PhoU [Clostridia bacterium]|nr:phosphate transport system regulatory protein PhoU [Clostridia bacterium]